MSYELFITFFIGFIVGALLNRSQEDRAQKQIYEDRYAKFDEDLHYYKKLCKTLADENAEFRRKQ